MHRRIFPLALTGFICIIIGNWSCTKLDTTSLGSDLIPAVDNVNTFADTFNVTSTQKNYLDTTFIGKKDNHVLGNITFDPLFGKTSASVFMQLKPPYYPFSFPDSIIAFDSVVLCLKYNGFWGDSNVVQTLQANEVIDPLFRDSIAKIWPVLEPPPAIGSPISQAVNVDIRRLGDSIKYASINATYINQIRLKLLPLYAAELYGSDSTLTYPGGNHAFHSDSIYRLKFNGIAIRSIGGGNALMYVNLADTNTKLEFHYRRTVDGKIDTTYQSFNMAASTTTSSTANSISRDRTGTPSSIPNSTEIYLQGQPGTYASISIPQLSGYSNKIIHRAELIVEQIPDNPTTDTIFSPPHYLYLDLKDSGVVKYKPIYFDLNPNTLYDPDNKTSYFYPSTAGVDYSYYGGYERKKTGPFGATITYYNINISRYVQQLVKNQNINYEMRLFPAYDIHYGQYSTFIPYNNNIAFGRIKVGSGTNPNYPMRLRIIYSPIK